MSFLLTFNADFGDRDALKDEIVSVAALSDPFFHLFVVALETSITAWSVFSGFVATMTAVRGISAFVDCDKFANEN